MSQRFFADTPIGTSTTAALVDAEAQHLTKVMRAKVGDEVTLFDGSGWEFLGRISKISKSSVVLEVLERNQVDRELARPVTVAVALPKGDRQRFLVEKLVELGVARLIPLDTQRAVAEATDSALERLRRQVIEAAKQCRRNRLMEVSPSLTVAQLIEQTTNIPRRILAHPIGEPLLRSSPSEATIVAVGPEGGFTEEEACLCAEAGWESISLGPRILRIETAAIALAAAISVSQAQF